MFKKESIRIRLLTLISSLCLFLIHGCSRTPVLPADMVLYCASDSNVVIKRSDKREEIFALEQADPRVITALAYDPIHKVIAISTQIMKVPSTGSARLLLIDPDTRKILREISTGMDRINQMSFDRTGQRIAIIAGQFNLDDPRKFYVLNLTTGSFQFMGQGMFLDVSWGLHEYLYLSYKEGEKRFVGSLTAGASTSNIKQIAEGISISASDINDSFVYIDMTGKALLVDKRTEVKRPFSTPAKLQDMRFLSSVKFVQGSDSIVMSSFGVQWYNLYLLRPPYSKAQKILAEWPFQGFAAVAAGQ